MTIPTKAKVWTGEVLTTLLQQGHGNEFGKGEGRSRGNSALEHGEISAYLAG